MNNFRRLFGKLILLSFVILLFLTFQNCGKSFEVETLSGSLNEASLTPPIPPISDGSPGALLKLKKIGGFNYGNGVCGIDFQDRVVCWGQTSAFPAVVTALPNSVDVVGMARGLCSLDTTGKVFCLQDVSNQSVVQEIVGVGKVIQITASNMMVCVLNDLAQVYCFGYPMNQGPTLSAVELPDLRGSKKISSNLMAVCGITPAKTVLCDKVFGSSQMPTTFQPLPVPGLTDIVDFKSTGGYPIGFCGLNEQGILKCLEFTDSTYTAFTQPVVIPGLGPVKYFDIGNEDGGVCAVQLDNRVLCQGLNDRFQINNSFTSEFTSATEVFQKEVLQIKRARANCVLNLDSTVQCWGTPGLALGIDLVHTSNIPYPFPALNGVLQMAFFNETFGNDVFILKDDGKVYCRRYGKRISQTPANEICPESPGDTFVSFRNLQNVKQIFGGRGAFMCALFNTGNVSCWGGLIRSLTTPSAESELGLIPILANTVQISIGDSLVCTLNSSGKVYCNDGSGGFAEATQASGANQIVMAQSSFCVRTANAEVKCHKRTSITDPTVAAVNIPLTNVSQIVTATDSSTYCALKTDGRVSCWNDLEGSTGNQPYMPADVPQLAGSKKLFPVIQDGILYDPSRAPQVCALDASDKVNCAGSILFGQLETKTFSNPEKVFVSRSFTCITNLSGNGSGTSCVGMKPFRLVGDLLGQPLRN